MVLVVFRLDVHYGSEQSFFCVPEKSVGLERNLFTPAAAILYERVKCSSADSLLRHLRLHFSMG